MVAATAALRRETQGYKHKVGMGIRVHGLWNEQEFFLPCCGLEKENAYDDGRDSPAIGSRIFRRYFEGRSGFLTKESATWSIFLR